MTFRFLLIFLGIFSLFIHAGEIRILDSEISQGVEITKVNLLESIKIKEEIFTSILEFNTTSKTKFFIDGDCFHPFFPNHKSLKKSIIDLVYYVVLLLKDNWKEACTVLIF